MIAYQATRVGKAMTRAFAPEPAAERRIAVGRTASGEPERCLVLSCQAGSSWSMTVAGVAEAVAIAETAWVGLADAPLRC